MTQDNTWQERNSQDFIDYGRFFVPQREYQIELIGDLIPPPTGPADILELSCGEGLLAESLLQRFPTVTLHGYDLSPTMLQQAQKRLAAFGNRYVPRRFNLADRDWRTNKARFHAAVSSLTIHHLDGPEKLRLFLDLYKMLLPGGALVIADLILPARPLGAAAAARAWDKAVEQRSQALAGDDKAFARFQGLEWNTFLYPEDPEESIDKPSGILDQLKWMEQAGFSAVDLHWALAGHVIFSGVK